MAGRTTYVLVASGVAANASAFVSAAATLGLLWFNLSKHHAG